MWCGVDWSGVVWFGSGAGLACTDSLWHWQWQRVGMPGHWQGSARRRSSSCCCSGSFAASVCSLLTAHCPVPTRAGRTPSPRAAVDQAERTRSNIVHHTFCIPGTLSEERSYGSARGIDTAGATHCHPHMYYTVSFGVVYSVPIVPRPLSCPCLPSQQQLARCNTRRMHARPTALHAHSQRVRRDRAPVAWLHTPVAQHCTLYIPHYPQVCTVYGDSSHRTCYTPP